MKLLPPGSSRRKLIILCALVFLLAFSVRLLTWHDTRFEVGKVQSSVATGYQHVAELLRQEGVRGFFSSTSPLAGLNNLGHPPGYSILIALVRGVFGNSTAAVQITQVVIDSLAAVLLLLIVCELFSPGPATFAGVFAALSPQFAWNSVLLLPDTLAVFPILLAVYLMARGREGPRLVRFLIVGALVGVSCWLRANAMLLTLFLAVAVMLLHGRKQWRYSLAVVLGTLLIVLPLTIRNAIVTRHFIPVSLGAGQTFLEGIADYDETNRFGIPITDVGIMKQEAEIYQRPDYDGTLFDPDGVARERARLKRGARVVASHPLWFAGVMAQRAASMTRLERARLISTTPAITHSLNVSNLKPVAMSAGIDLLRQCRSESPHASLAIDPDAMGVTLAGDGTQNSRQFSCGPMMSRDGADFLLEIKGRIHQGRLRVATLDAIGRPYVSEILEPLEIKQPAQQPVQTLRLPFVSLGSTVQLELSNEASPAPPLAQLDSLALYELGAARLLWTRYPKMVLRAVQRIFITAVFLPLAIIGMGVTILRQRWPALLILMIVPLYFFTVQSAFHTEYRYVLAVNYFLFAFAAVTIAWVVELLYRKASSLSFWERVRVRA